MAYLGDFRLGKTFDCGFTTIDGSGAPTTLSSSPAVAAYEDNSTTEITAGITLSTDHDSRTGLNNIRVVATSGNGYAAGKNYKLVVTAGSVGGVSIVGYVLHHFSIENRSALMPATADRTLVVDASGLADANAVKVGPTGSGTAQTARDIGASVLLSSGTGTGQVKLSSGYVAPNWGDVGNPTTAVDLSGTSTKALEPTTAGRKLDVTTTGGAGIDWGNVENQSTTVGLSGTTVKTATDVETDTQDIQARLPAALTGGGNMKADALAINGNTTAASLQALAARGVVTGSAITGTLSSTEATTDLTEATDDHYNDRAVVWITGTLAGQASTITDYVGATKKLVYDATPTGEAPSNGDVFIIV